MGDTAQPDLEPRFRLSDIATAAGVSVNTIRAWFHRGHVSFLETDSHAPGAGLAHSLSIRSALRIACVKALRDLGVHPKLADEAALVWLDIGDDRRAEGQLLDLARHGETVLWVFPDAMAEVASADEVLCSLWANRSNRRGGTFIVLNDLDARVRAALGGR